MFGLGFALLCLSLRAVAKEGNSVENTVAKDENNVQNTGDDETTYVKASTESDLIDNNLKCNDLSQSLFNIGAAN